MLGQEGSRAAWAFSSRATSGATWRRRASRRSASRSPTARHVCMAVSKRVPASFSSDRALRLAQRPRPPVLGHGACACW